MRRVPLQRVPIRSKARPERRVVERVRAPLTPIRVPEPSAKVFRQTPKHVYVRSDALMRAYRALPCQHCGAEGEDAGVCGAHANWAAFGKGKSVKASDDACASLCWKCHALLDQGKSWSADMKRFIWASARIKTVAKLVALKLWPAGIPLPDMTLATEWAANVSRETP